MNRTTQWTPNEKTYHFCCSFKSMLFFIAVKKYTKSYHIICSLCRSTHLESNTIRFSILWFFYDLLWFFKTDLSCNLIGFGKFGDINRFIVWELCSQPPIGEEVIQIFFLTQNQMWPLSHLISLQIIQPW